MDASAIIDEKLASLTDWRGDMLRAVRKTIHEVAPDVIEEWKWMGSPVWNKNGILFVANAHKDAVRVTFLHGAKVPDPKGIFNAELEGHARRAIKWQEGDRIDLAGLKAVMRGAIAYNAAKPAARKPDAVSSVSGKKPVAKLAKKAAAKRKAPAKTKTR